MRINTLSWAEIIEFYRHCAEEEGLAVEGLLQLVRHVAMSPYASGLYPYQSHTILVLAQTPEVLNFQERIVVRQLGPELYFGLTDQPSWIESLGGELRPPTVRGQPSWHHRVPSTDGVAALTRLLDRLGWFPRPAQSLRGPGVSETMPGFPPR